MELSIPVASLFFLCALVGPAVQEENFYSSDYSQEMLRKLESEIFAKASPLQPVDYLMLYVIELKQGMTVLNDTVSNIGREYHDLWKQEVEDMARSSSNAQCSCNNNNNSNADEVEELKEKVDAIRGDVQRVLEELQRLRNAPPAELSAPPAEQSAQPASRPDDHVEPSPSQREREAVEAVREFTGRNNWPNVRRSLEYVLDPSSTAYKQLKDIGPQDNTPLKSAAEKGYTELLEALLDGGLPVDTLADDVWRYDLLSAAAMSGQVLVVEMLLQRGAQTEVVNNRGVTPLMFAASKNHLAVVKLLVEFGADVARQNYDGHTALDLARKRNNREVVDFLSPYAHSQVGPIPSNQ